MKRAGAPRRAFILFGAVAVALVTLEAGALVTTLLAGRLLGDPIRTRSAIFEGQTEFIAWLLADDANRDQRDSILGWRYRPGHLSDWDRLNSIGLRGDREYQPEPSDSVRRVAAFGDSFVYSSEVDWDEAWPHQIEQRHDRYEVLNYGVGGYGTDQALLRYRLQGADFAPSVVIIGFTPVNLGRNVNVYRRFVSPEEWPWTKPRFVVRDDSLELLPNPMPTDSHWRRVMDEPERVRDLGQHDWWYEPLIYESAVYDYSATYRLLATAWIRLRNRYFRPDRLMADGVFNPNSPAFDLQVRLLRTFAQEVRDRGAQPVVLIMPGRSMVTNRRDGRRAIYAPLVDRLSNDVVWDGAEAFANSDDVDGWFAVDGHYSSLGNTLMADWVALKLDELFR